jgi:hypothetical protein
VLLLPGTVAKRLICQITSPHSSQQRQEPVPCSENDNSNKMDYQVQRIIAGSADETQAATAAVLEALKQGSLNVLGLVSQLVVSLLPINEQYAATACCSCSASRLASCSVP